LSYEPETLKVLEKILDELREIRRELKPHHPKFPTGITFQETTMLPTVGGNTLIFTGTLVPAGATLPTDAVVTVSSNDPAVSPSVDKSGLVVTVPLPTGWVENPTTPLAITYAAASASNPTWELGATITPSAPPAILPTGINFAQTT
jgi:hypothetical protein